MYMLPKCNNYHRMLYFCHATIKELTFAENYSCVSNFLFAFCYELIFCCNIRYCIVKFFFYGKNRSRQLIEIEIFFHMIQFRFVSKMNG